MDIKTRVLRLLQLFALRRLFFSATLCNKIENMRICRHNFLSLFLSHSFVSSFLNETVILRYAR